MYTENIGHHISGLFNKDLEEIRHKVLVMGGLVEQQLDQSIQAFISSDMEMAERVIQQDNEVNAMEACIERECTQILALRQPAAFDLRFLLAVLKIIYELERMGDKAKRIAQITVRLAVNQAQVSYYELVHMAELVKGMLLDALNAFARLSLDSVLVIAQQDEKVDREYDSILRQLITRMMEDSRNITRTLDVLWTVRALERIGSHACHICEHLVYALKGEYVNHMSPQELEAKLTTPSYEHTIQVRH
ncbi:MAG: phosphate signaling complex protein PhoU [Methylovulum sp.]|nr:phosphate signaling complex protein PhoU [Methylovulum sp.]MCF7998117.1 phosphate signaling complex protein PhoU [Methylovulum sp.]